MGLSDVVAAGGLKTEAVLDVLPSAPNGDCSELAKADRPDEAKAEVEVTWAEGVESSLPGDVEVTSDANGETADVFKNAPGRED
jgi:hypothetical protein